MSHAEWLTTSAVIGAPSAASAPQYTPAVAAAPMSVAFPVTRCAPAYAAAAGSQPMRPCSQPRQNSSSAGPIAVARRAAISSLGRISRSA